MNQTVQTAPANAQASNELPPIATITLQEIEARENALASNTAYCCILNVSF